MPPRDTELTVRAVLIGCAVGALLVTANVYMGLKTGWNDSGNVTASILGFALLGALQRIGGRASSGLETNIVQSVATAAAGMAFTSGLSAAIPALSLMHHDFPSWALVAWSMAAGVLGIAIAARLRERLFVIESLPFPTGVSTSELIRTMHRIAGAGRERALMLLSALGAGGLATWLRDGRPSWIPQATMLRGHLAGLSLQSLSFGIAWSPMMFGAGLLIGPHLGASLFLGSVIAFAALAPPLVHAKLVAGADYASLVAWLLWPAVAMMVASTLTSIFVDRGTFLRAAKAARADVRGSASDREARLFWPLCAIATVGLVLVGWRVFGVSPVILIPTVGVAILLAGVAARAAGETDINPIGQVGQLTQLGVGSVVPWQPVSNLVAGSITVGATSQTGAAIWALNAGHRLGASVRSQLLAQLIGTAIGALVAVPVYLLIVGAYKLGSPLLPAPGALPWKAVAEGLAHGTSAMPRFAASASLVGVAVGVLLTVLGRTRARRFSPSPMALGIGMLVPAFYSVAIFAGAIALAVVRWRRPPWIERHVPSVAAGLIAGESLVGVLVAALMLLGVL